MQAVRAIKSRVHVTIAKSNANRSNKFQLYTTTALFSGLVWDINLQIIDVISLIWAAIGLLMFVVRFGHPSFASLQSSRINKQTFSRGKATKVLDDNHQKLINRHD